jgi:hypothetical protein
VRGGIEGDTIDGGDGTDIIVDGCSGDDTINVGDGIAGNDAVFSCGPGEDTVRRDYQAGPTPKFDKVFASDCEHIINVPV